MSTLLTAQTPGSSRNNYSDRVGLRLTVGAADVVVSALGRWIDGGNSQTHVLALVNAGGTDLGTVTVDTNGQAANDYVYADLSSPVTLTAGASYYLVSTETNGGDGWRDEGDVTASADFAGVNAAYRSGGVYTAGTGGRAFVPVNLLYELDAGGTAPDAPTGLSATPINATRIDLAWTDASDDETGFEVDRSPNGSTGWTTLATTAANATTYSDTGLTPETPYYYRVRAVNGDGNSSYATDDATTPAGPSITLPAVLWCASYLPNAAAKATANTAAWQSFKARLDEYLPLYMNDLPEGNYQGSQLALALDYALGYRALKDAGLEATLRVAYADKAANLIRSSITSTMKGTWGGRVYLGRGDGVTTTFDLPYGPVVSNVRNRGYLVPVATYAYTREGDDTFQVGTYSHPVKISDTSDGAEDYVRGVDWDIDPDAVDCSVKWLSGGDSPAASATFYCTIASPTTGPAGGVTFGTDTVTFDAAPTADYAVFAQFMYGEAGDPDGGPYQESSDGRGGFNAVFYDNGFAIQFLARVAVALGYLHDYAGVSEQLRDDIGAMMPRWYDRSRDYGYYPDSAQSNYGAGGIYTQHAIAIAAQGVASDAHAEAMRDEAAAWYADNLVPQWSGDPANGFATLKGGHWPEGYAYSSEAVTSLLQFALAMDDAGFIADADVARAWATERILQIIAERYASGQGWFGGDLYPQGTVTGAAPSSIELRMLAAAADDADAASYARYFAGSPPVDASELLFGVTGGASVNPATAGLPLARYASGTGTVTSRKDHALDSTWLCFESGPPVVADHQDFSAGVLILTRGTDVLLSLPDSLAGKHTLYRSDQASLVAVDDADGNVGGDDSDQLFPWLQTYQQGPVGASITTFEDGTGYTFAVGDYKNAYGNPNNVGGAYTTTASKLTRSVLHVRGSDYVIVYDRVTLRDADYGQRLQWMTTTAITEGVAGEWSTTSGSSKLFARTYSGETLTQAVDTYTVTGFSSTSVTARRVKLSPPNGTTACNYVTALQTAASGVSAMDATAHVVGAVHEGVKVGSVVAMFGKAGTAIADGTSYSITATNGQTVTHYVADLTPDAAFDLVGATTGSATASDAGVLTFATTGTGSAQSIVIGDAEAPEPDPLVAGELTLGTPTISTIPGTFTGGTGGEGTISRQVQVSANGSTGWTNVSGATASPFTITGLSPSTLRYVRVRYVAGEETVYSSTASATTATEEVELDPLVAGTLSSPSHTSTTATLAWTDATGDGTVTAQLQRRLSGVGSYANVSGATTSPFTDTGLTASTAYDYRVAFADDNGTANSNAVTVTTSATRPRLALFKVTA